MLMLNIYPSLLSIVVTSITCQNLMLPIRVQLFHLAFYFEVAGTTKRKTKIPRHMCHVRLVRLGTGRLLVYLAPHRNEGQEKNSDGAA